MPEVKTVSYVKLADHLTLAHLKGTEQLRLRQRNFDPGSCPVHEIALTFNELQTVIHYLRAVQTGEEVGKLFDAKRKIKTEDK
jgi:hypothetical protein